MININRHNYEEFFLLYTDRELSPAEKMAVEQFVQENPDLADEFAALQQTTLPVEETILMDKSLLFRNAGEEIGSHNHTEQFLLYVDNELTLAEREAVETFVLQHPTLQEEFVQLKQTILPTEQILFPDKNSLYRTEEKRKPVIYMRWTRMIAAAVVISFGFFLWTLTGNTDPVNPDNNQLAVVSGKKIISPDNTNSPAAVLVPAVSDKENNTGSMQHTIASTQKPATVLQESLAVNTPLINNREELKIMPELITERQNTISIDEPVKSAMGARTITGITASTAINESDLVTTIAKPDTDEATAKDALFQQVVYKELDTESDSENKSLFIGTVEINKDKLRGFFRKAGSIFRSKKSEETTNTGTSTTKSLK